MKHKKRLTKIDRFRFIASWLNYAVPSKDTVESWEEDHIGADLAWLCLAIVNDGKCEWPKDRPLVKLILKKDPKQRAAIWRFIDLVPE